MYFEHTADHNLAAVKMQTHFEEVHICFRGLFTASVCNLISSGFCCDYQQYIILPISNRMSDNAELAWKRK